MPQQFDQIASQAIEQIAGCEDIPALEALRVHYLGKKGVVTGHLKSLDQIAPEERAEVGKTLNQLKQQITLAIEERKASLGASAMQAQFARESVDVTAPGMRQDYGCSHPISQTMRQVEELFLHIGFEIKKGPEIEDEVHNFEALNIPPDHPARAMHDTFYLDDALLLRTHTSPVQIRVMRDARPPIRIIAPGRVYRRDLDPTHSPMFHQVEGLVVDTSDKVSFARLKGTVNAFLREFFVGEDIEIRFRPSYFPFTEPSAEIDIRRASGSWLEVMGCGMVHPAVLKGVDIDPSTYAGYAFGLGIERLAMLKYGIDDLRLLFDNHLGLLSQFPR